MSVLTSTAARVVSAVPAYWAKQSGPGQKQPDTGIGGDELLPLIAYVTIRANIPNIFSEAAFMELLIHDDVSIQQEVLLLLWPQAEFIPCRDTFWRPSKLP